MQNPQLCLIPGIKHFSLLHPVPQSAIWCLVGLSNKHWSKGPQGPPLCLSWQETGSSFHRHSPPCWPGASGDPGWGQSFLPISQYLKREKVASLLKTFTWCPISLRVRFKVLTRLPKSSWSPPASVNLLSCTLCPLAPESLLLHMVQFPRFVNMPWILGLCTRPRVGSNGF